MVSFILLRVDAQNLEEWARAQTGHSLVDFGSKEGEVEAKLKEIAERAGNNGSFSYSRFFAVGLFRLLELANATEPTLLKKVEYYGCLICYYVQNETRLTVVFPLLALLYFLL